MVPYTFELPSDTPPAGYVDVAITHCGICHSDVHQINDAWRVACFPLVAGHEIVGTVAAVGAGVDDFAVGDRAAIGVQRSCCGSCVCCDEGLEQICSSITKTYAGPGKDRGGFARLIRYPAAWVFSPPAQLASELVAPLMCAGITTYSPLKRHGRAGDRVGIIGIGGLGHVALQFARAMGFAEVVALSRSADKEAEARSFGAGAFLNTDDPEAMATAAGSFELLLSTASGHAPLDSYLALLRPRGTLCCVGLPDKDEQSRLFLQSIVPAERNIVGSYLGPHADYEEMLAFAAEHGVAPAVEVRPASEINAAIARVRDNAARYRMVLSFEEEEEPG